MHRTSCWAARQVTDVLSGVAAYRRSDKKCTDWCGEACKRPYAEGPTRYGDGRVRHFRNLTVLPYAEGGITGERMYAEDEFYRCLFGPILDELETISP